MPAVVIPTLGEGRPKTLDSVPHGVETYVVAKGNRSEARNIGVERSVASPIVFCDDDIAFDHETFWTLVDMADRETVVGLADFEFGLALTRFMVADRGLFNAVGGFDERLTHMEDTEFCLRVRQYGASIETVPRERVDHADHESRVSRWQRLRALAYVTAKHPRWAPSLATAALERALTT